MQAILALHNSFRVTAFVLDGIHRVIFGDATPECFATRIGLWGSRAERERLPDVRPRLRIARRKKAVFTPCGSPVGNAAKHKNIAVHEPAKSTLPSRDNRSLLEGFDGFRSPKAQCRQGNSR